MLYHIATLPHGQRYEDILGLENNLQVNHLLPNNTRAGHKIQRNTTKKHDSCAFAVQNNELIKLILNSNVKCLTTSKQTMMKKGASGIQPPTFQSAVECSTTELHYHMPNAMQRYLVLRTISKEKLFFPKYTKPRHKLQ